MDKAKPLTIGITKLVLSIHHTRPEKFENATLFGHFRFVFEENSGREEKNNYHDTIVFVKLRFQGVFQIPPV